MDPRLKSAILKVLNKGEDSPIPMSIAVELAAFFDTNPSDVSFRLSLLPGGQNRGFGTITCREDVCGLEVSLTESIRQPEGGRGSGCGSLDVYKNHCDNSLDHIASRNSRLARVNNAGDDSRLLKTAASAHLAIADKVMGNRKSNSAATSVARPFQNYPVDRKPSAAALAAEARQLQARKPDIIMIDSDEEDIKPLASKRAANPVIYSDEDKKPDKKPRYDERDGVFRDHVNGNLKPKPNAPAPPNATYDKLYVDTSRSLKATEALIDQLKAIPPHERQQVFFAEWDAAATRQVSFTSSLTVYRNKWGNPTENAIATQRHEQRMADLGASPAWTHALSANLAIIARVRADGQRAAPNPMAGVMDLLGGGMGAAAMGYGGGGGGNRSDDEDHVDHGGKDFNAFLAAAAEGDAFEGNTTVEKARDTLKLKANNVLKGMAIPLLPHQIIGVAWMAEQENSSSYGGILGDEMGLGKTIQTIGLMCLNASADAREKTNLIVAPLALLEQWKDEIESKCVEGQQRCLIYHGPTKTNFLRETSAQRRRINDAFSRYDVVLTTYSTLALEWPDEETLLKKAKKERNAKLKAAGLPPAELDAEDPEFDAKEQGALFKMSWYRVILDEAQGIRNRSTRVSRAVVQLDSFFRWCLTGTPITNSLADVFPLLRFCQIKPWYTFAEFSGHILVHEKKRPELAGKKCQAILRRHMLRRKKDSKLDGKQLITLPEKHVEMRVLEFSPEERDIYTFVETRTQAKFNKFLKAGTVLKNYAHVLVLLLRLRQLTCHPSLISDGFDALAVQKEGQAEIERAIAVLGQELVNKLKQARLAIAVKRLKAEKENVNAIDEDEGCPVCLEPEGEGEGGSVVTKCGHTFCRVCIDAVLAKEAPEADVGDDIAPKYKNDERPCPSCRGPISNDFIFKSIAFDPTDEELSDVIGAPVDEAVDDDEEDEDAMPAMRKMKRKQIAASEDEDEEMAKPVKAVVDVKGKGKAKKEVVKKEEESDNWMDIQEPSTKMKWLYEEIQRCSVEAPGDKFMVLCNFTSMLAIVRDYLNSKGIRTTGFQGDMSRKARDESLKKFKKSKNVNVLLMSLKSGGVGLNIVCANRVVNLDLAWSHAVEDQAFSRVHRIGQAKEVYIDRLTINNTVEQRIGEMQERKKALADASLGEGNGDKLGKLSVGDIAALFGLDVNGRRVAPRPPVAPRAARRANDADGPEI